ncbi:uncharacterized protein LOC129581636 isoform X2 [Paramacrobiotus metropolitanus]|uniref:uncharacterized protein LOC129581636 isoform X2 n=1 Tax=Paramacrobiotus metropolitanus TaxID=2943436 RepID=UPI002445ECA4|nr:uncharacterized protein LOC129581636 isoform X2 [Paramacrobiotus metropolitanus]
MPPRRKSLTGRREASARKQKATQRNSTERAQQQKNDRFRYARRTTVSRPTENVLQSNQSAVNNNNVEPQADMSDVFDDLGLDDDVSVHNEQPVEIVEHGLDNRERRYFRLPSRAARNFMDERSVAKLSIGPMDTICKYCTAFNFPSEKNFKCCHRGKVSLSALTVPAGLVELVTGGNKDSENYLEFVRQYNSANAFASLGADIARPPGFGPYTFRIHGQVHHYLWTALPANPAPLSYGSLYFLNTEQALSQRMNRDENKVCNPLIMAKIQKMLVDCNPYAHLFRHMGDVFRDSASLPAEMRDVSVVFLPPNGSDPRRYNDPRCGEVAAVFVSTSGEPPAERDIVVYSKTDRPSRISPLSPHCDPMVYPLLFPKGEFGWHPAMTHDEQHRTAKRPRVTQLQFYAYRLAVLTICG